MTVETVVIVIWKLFLVCTCRIHYRLNYSRFYCTNLNLRIPGSGCIGVVSFASLFLADYRRLVIML